MAGAAGGTGVQREATEHWLDCGMSRSSHISSLHRSLLLSIPPFLQRAQGAFIFRPLKVLQHLSEVEKNSEPPRCPTVRLESSPPLPKPKPGQGPGHQQGVGRCTPGREDRPGCPGAQLSLPLFSEAFWDDSGHVLNILGGQGATRFEGQSSYRIANRPTTNYLGEY